MRDWVARAVDAPMFTAADRDWQDVPGVRIVGAILGTLLLVAAIRSMFGGRRK